MDSETVEKPKKEKQEQRQIGQYTVLEHTARKLVGEMRGRYPIALGILWSVLIVLAVFVAPWQGGTRLFLTIVAAIVALSVSLMVAYFTPLTQRITVDVEQSICLVEWTYLIRSKRSWQLPMPDVCGIRLRRKVWRDPGSVAKVEWVVEVTDQDDQAWLMAENDEREPMADLARLTAEVAGCKLEEQQ